MATPNNFKVTDAIGSTDNFAGAEVKFFHITLIQSDSSVTFEPILQAFGSLLNKEKLRLYNCEVLVSSYNLIKNLLNKESAYFFCKKKNIKI